jgi:hypothetical protein
MRILQGCCCILHCSGPDHQNRQDTTSQPLPLSAQPFLQSHITESTSQVWGLFFLPLPHHFFHCLNMPGTPQNGPVVQPCRYKTGKVLGAGSYSVVKECVHIETGRYYAAKVINKRLMQGREHMVRSTSFSAKSLLNYRLRPPPENPADINANRCATRSPY